MLVPGCNGTVTICHLLLLSSSSVDMISYDKHPVFTACNSECLCSASDWDPVCGENGITYVSPCLAGCSTSAGSGRNTVSWQGTHTIKNTHGKCINVVNTLLMCRQQLNFNSLKTLSQGLLYITVSQSPNVKESFPAAELHPQIDMIGFLALTVWTGIRFFKQKFILLSYKRDNGVLFEKLDFHQSGSFNTENTCTPISAYMFVCKYVYICIYVCVSVSCYTLSLVCDCVCLSRSSLTVAVSVRLVTLRPPQVSAFTRTTATGCSRTSWLSLSSLPSSSPLVGHPATWFSSGQTSVKQNMNKLKGFQTFLIIWLCLFHHIRLTHSTGAGLTPVALFQAELQSFYFEKLSALVWTLCRLLDRPLKYLTCNVNWVKSIIKMYL